MTDETLLPPKLPPKKRRRGPTPKPLTELRNHRISIYLTDEELIALVAQAFPGEDVDPKKKGLRQALARYMRDATFDRIPPQIPAINREAWIELSRLAGNFNGYLVAIKQGHAQGMLPDLIVGIRDQVQVLRRELIGISSATADEAKDGGAA